MKSKSKKAVLLLSGGLDSLTCLAIALSQDYEIYALSFSYGQRHSSELDAAKRIAMRYPIQEHKIFEINLAQFGGSALTDFSMEVPDFKKQDDIPSTYVPARNTIFLAIALGYAEVVDADAIIIGASAIDYSGYPDCRPEYMATFQELANLATKKSTKGKKMQIFTPLINLSKAQTIQKGIELGVDYSLSVSCYRASDQGLACGKCDSCALRKKGFKEAQIADPTRYQD